jgi:hypothetical protein
MTTSRTEDYELIIDRMVDSAHGSAPLQDLIKFFSRENGWRKSRMRESFIKDRWLRQPIEWLDIKERV